jgi:hypothetical protein
MAGHTVPGQCQFCEVPLGRVELRSCPWHRALEAYALVLAQGFVEVAPETPKVGDEAIAPAFLDWMGSEDKGETAKRRADVFWPPDLTSEESLRLWVVSTDLILRLIEESTATHLARLDDLVLTQTERAWLLGEVLGYIRASREQQGDKVSLESTDAAGGTYRTTRGRLRKTTERFRLTISDFGSIEETTIR